MDKDFLAIFNAIKADGANADYTCLLYTSDAADD